MIVMSAPFTSCGATARKKIFRNIPGAVDHMAFKEFDRKKRYLFVVDDF